ncbi:MAG: RNase P modulator RnpM [Dethiobacteria bacterium]|jgi:predicted RNA-binding protein YlxR (DUF448 family)
MAKKRKVVQRMCLSCRLNKEKKELIRIVRTPKGEIELDPTGKKAGRGAYICPSKECLQKAIKGKALEKNLRAAIPTNVIELLEEKFKGF